MISDRYTRERNYRNKQLRHKRISAAREKGTHTKEEWQVMAEFFKVCVRCQGESGLKNIEKDHIVPVYMGGSDSIRNIQPVCAKCNASKGHEYIDHRISFCLDRGVTMPQEWVHDGIGATP
jgi:5-methylcytosine-specific restriction endonuclease McrA